MKLKTRRHRLTPSDRTVKNTEKYRFPWIYRTKFLLLQYTISQAQMRLSLDLVGDLCLTRLTEKMLLNITYRLKVEQSGQCYNWDDLAWNIVFLGKEKKTFSTKLIRLETPKSTEANVSMDKGFIGTGTHSIWKREFPPRRKLSIVVKPFTPR